MPPGYYSHVDAMFKIFTIKIITQGIYVQKSSGDLLEMKGSKNLVLQM